MSARLDMTNLECAVSVIMPAFNAQSYIAEAVRSVLDQTQPALELIVVDDGSTDATRDIVQAIPGVTCIHQPNSGVAAALNAGCLHARGDHLAFISADDVWSSDKLQLQRDQVLKTPGVLVFGHMQNFISPDIPEDEASRLQCPPEPMPAYSAGTLLTNRRTFNAVGKFNETYSVGEFIDWYGRATDLGITSIMLDNVLSNRRLHKHNHSKNALNKKSYAPVLKALLDRRRLKEKQA